jgi:ParB family chromosome partitioning protein
VGEVEHENRGGDGSGHTGAVTALLFLPQAAKDGEKELGDRLLSAGADGKVRVWRLEDRRKPRTLDAGGHPVSGMAFAPAASAKEGLGAIFAAGEKRTVFRFGIDKQGAPEDSSTQLEHGFAVLSQGLTGARPARETAVKTLAALDEPEALELLVKILRTDREAEVRTLAAKELGAKARRGAKSKLREALDDDHTTVRHAARRRSGRSTRISRSCRSGRRSRRARPRSERRPSSSSRSSATCRRSSQGSSPTGSPIGTGWFA